MNKKMTTLALAGLMAVSGAAQASIARWDGLGLSSTWVADVQDTWTLPTAVLDNGNSMFMENPDWGSGSGVWGGANIALGGGQLGIWSGRDITPDKVMPGLSMDLMGNYTDWMDIDTSYNGFYQRDPRGDNSDGLGIDMTADMDLLYGMSVNDNTQVALGITLGNETIQDYNHEKQDNNTAGVNDGLGDRDGREDHQSKGAFGVSLGLGMAEVGPLSGLWAGLSWMSINNKYEYKSDNISGNYNSDEMSERAYSDIQFRLSAEQAGDSGSMLYDLFLDLENSKDTVSNKYDNDGSGSIDADEEETYEGKDSAMHLTLGGAKMMSGDKGFGLVGLLLDMTNRSGDGDYSYAGNTEHELRTYSSGNLGLDWAAGAEAQAFFDWLTLRAGISGNLWNSRSLDLTFKDDQANYNERKDSSSGSVDYGVSTSVGFSVALGDFVIDSVLDPNFLSNGPYFVSGSSSAMSYEVSATWAFGGKE